MISEYLTLSSSINFPMTHTHMCQFWETSKGFCVFKQCSNISQVVVVIMPPQTSY